MKMWQLHLYHLTCLLLILSIGYFVSWWAASTIIAVIALVAFFFG